MITDYDCWHPDHESVTGAQIMVTLQQNAENAQKVLREAIKSMPDARGCKCGSALAHALSPTQSSSQSHKEESFGHHREIHS